MASARVWLTDIESAITILCNIVTSSVTAIIGLRSSPSRTLHEILKTVSYSCNCKQTVDENKSGLTGCRAVSPISTIANLNAAARLDVRDDNR